MKARKFWYSTVSVPPVSRMDRNSVDCHEISVGKINNDNDTV